ncbi:NB-ARC domain-containing protein [Kutzneria sp. NPDC051319]|uniref:NB-ARC domain-containing protein n=1 Tax=Kutzneria sp. NPDC051319 TaxID=3155047 RepID=UPI0034461968
MDEVGNSIRDSFVGFAVQAGRISGGVHVHAASPVGWPHRVGVVPPLADCRQLRSADTELASQSSGCLVLTGLGGVGKTQLAAALAHRVWSQREVDLVVWVTATSRTSVVASYAQAIGDITGGADPDQDQAADRFLAWLEATDRRWLVVLDDLTDPADLHRLWPPTSGRTVVTTRREDHALTAGRLVVRVCLFSPSESLQYLEAKLSSAQLSSAADLAYDLGHLPLALSQAAAYILDRDLTCADYRTRLAERRLTDLVPEPSARPDDYRNAVTETWSLSIELADRLRPEGLAGSLLRIAALLDPNGIPARLFTTPVVLNYLGPEPVHPDDARDALRCLHRLSLATLDEATDTLRVHNLLQRVVREQTNDLAVPAGIAADALMDLWSEAARDERILLANTAALQESAGSTLWSADGADVGVLFVAGASLGGSRQDAAAAAYFERLHATAVDQVGPNHHITLDARHQGAFWQGVAGDPAGAAVLLAELADLQRQILGPDHPNVLHSRAQLAQCAGEAGDTVAAASELDRIVEDGTRIFGAEDAFVLNLRYLLAHWQGKSTDPVSAWQELVADYLRVQGPDSRMTIVARWQLTNCLAERGDMADAVAMLEELLLDMLRVLGPDHPETLTVRRSLVTWREQAGGGFDATELRTLSSDADRLLGSDHPFTLELRWDVATRQILDGDLLNAVEVFQGLLNDHVQVYGDGHPNAAAVREILAVLQKRAT